MRIGIVPPAPWPRAGETKPVDVNASPWKMDLDTLEWKADHTEMEARGLKYRSQNNEKVALLGAGGMLAFLGGVAGTAMATHGAALGAAAIPLGATFAVAVSAFAVGSWRRDSFEIQADRKNDDADNLRRVLEMRQDREAAELEK